MCNATFHCFTCTHALYISLDPCDPVTEALSEYYTPDSCTITLTPITKEQPCPACSSPRYLAPPHLDISVRAKNKAERRARNTPWRLEDAQFWVLDCELLREARSVIEERSTGREMSTEEAMADAKCRYHIGRLAEEKQGEMMNAMQLVEQLMSDARMPGAEVNAWY